MTLALRRQEKLSAANSARAIEGHFPIVAISQLAERESWRKELGRPIYHIHKWWATRLGSVFRAIALGAVADEGTDIWQAFYNRHDFKDKVVLDPFMGSGTTLGEALKLGCSVVGCDINPVSTFLVRQALTPVSEAVLRSAFEALEAKVSAEIKRYYMTRDPETGEAIPVLYAFWVKEVHTPSGEAIPLFSNYIFSRDAYPKKRPKAQILCPSCAAVFADRYDATDLDCPSCGHGFNPQIGPASGQKIADKAGNSYRVKDLLPADGTPPSERLYALMAVRKDGTKIYLAPQEHDFALYREASDRLKREQLPLPTSEVRAGHNTNQARGYGFTKWADFFNDRHKLCLGLLLREILAIEDVPAREQMLCLFSSTLEFNNRFCSFKGEGTGAVRHMFSNHILKPERTPLENSVWGGGRSSGTFSTLFESRLLPAKRYLAAPFEIGTQDSLFAEPGRSPKIVASAPLAPHIVQEWPTARREQTALILNGDSAALPLPDRSVDAVVTDPPYFDFIHYSELSDFFFAWLSPVLAADHAFFDKPNSSDPGEVQHKESAMFAYHLGRVLAESSRVLKDDGPLCFSFHHSRSEGWRAIYEALRQADFTVVASHPLHAELRGSSPKSAAKDPISLDAILVCRKRAAVGSLELTDADIIARTKAKATELMAGGMTISQSDIFVIAAGELLIGAGGVSPEAFEERLDQLREKLPRPEACAL